jgi:hypothetical protein
MYPKSSIEGRQINLDLAVNRTMCTDTAYDWEAVLIDRVPLGYLPHLAVLSRHTRDLCESRMEAQDVRRVNESFNAWLRVRPYLRAPRAPRRCVLFGAPTRRLHTDETPILLFL